MGQGTDDYIFVTPMSFDHKATCYAAYFTTSQYLGQWLAWWSAPNPFPTLVKASPAKKKRTGEFSILIKLK